MHILDSVSWTGRHSGLLARCVARCVRRDVQGDLRAMIDPIGRYVLSGGRVIAVVLLLTLTACATPQVQYIDRVRFVDRVQQVVKPIDPELLQLHPIAEGPPSQCLSVAAQRRAELEKCNADKAATTAIAGAKEPGDE
jgi:hypothetical protein